jgi:hypothetical protein
MDNTLPGLFLSFLEDAIPRGPSLKLRAGNGANRTVMVDTGSQGIVLPWDAIGNDAVVMPEPTPPTPSYSSSGNKYQGTWMLATVQITGENGATFTTSKPVPVFGATSANGEPVTGESTLGMMGVGIRGLDQDPHNSMNAFLNLPQMEQGEFRTGYILSRWGVWFGYPASVVGEFQTFPTNCAFHDKQLTPVARVTLTPPAGSPLTAYTHLGPLLMDTGLGEMILTTPQDQTPPDAGFGDPKGNLVPGVDVALALQDGSGAWQTLWEFNSSQCSRQPDAPAFVRLVPPGGYGMTNTGRHLLARYDYLADLQFSGTGASGVVGLRPRPGG